MSEEQTDASAEAGPAIVLVRPQLAVNIGTAARAMANFGLSDLRLVAPREGWPLTGVFKETAIAAASGAAGLLDTARVFATAQDAIGDLHLVYATTARERGQGKPILAPEAAMSAGAAGATAGTRLGIMFGPERTGLDNDEIVLADAIVTFPVSPAYGSLNVAQAVLLMSYEWFKARHGAALPFSETEHSPPARKDDILSFFDYLEAALTDAGYFRPEDKQPIMRRNLRNIFQRAPLSTQDIRTLRGAVVRLVEGQRLPGRRRDFRKSGGSPEPDA